jgi:hypothetical protein
MKPPLTSFAFYEQGYQDNQGYGIGKHSGFGVSTGRTRKNLPEQASHDSTRDIQIQQKQQMRSGMRDRKQLGVARV